VHCALARIDECPARSGGILARIAGQTVMDALFDNQRVKIPEKMAKRAVEVGVWRDWRLEIGD
jgi:hypothetical protein